MSLPPLPDIKELLHDIDTHGNVWSRLAGDENYHALSRTVADFRSAARPTGSAAFASVLALADAFLVHHDAIHTSLEDLRDDVETDDNDQGTEYFSHELAALDNLRTTRRSLISLPPRGASPLEEFDAFQRFALLLGKEIIVEFESRDGAVVIDLAYVGTEPSDDTEITDRIMILTDCLVACDVSDWKDGAGTQGRIRLSGTDTPWIDAVDRKENWLLERDVDLEELAEMTWADDPDVTP